MLDGGEQNIVVASKNNILSNVRSRNGWRNLSTWYDQATSGSSGVRIENSVFESATSVGVVLQHVSAELDGSTIRKSAQAGLYITNAWVRAAGSAVDSNGVSSSRSGVEVLYGGTFTTGYDFDRHYGGGNRISTNSLHEVRAYSGSAVFLGSAPGSFDAENSIYDAQDACSTSKRLVENASGSLIQAHYNYWGAPAGSLSPACFSSNVDHAYELATDPTAGWHPGSDAPEAAFMPVGALAGSEGIPASPTARLQAEMRALRSRLDATPDAADAAVLLRHLHGLMLRDHEDVLGEHQANLDVLRPFSALLGSNPAGPAREAAETAALLEVWEALRTERYDEALRLLQQYAPLAENVDTREAMTMQHVSLLERGGYYGEALRVIAGVRESRIERARQQGRSEAALTAETAALTTREETLHYLMASLLHEGTQQPGAASLFEPGAAEAVRAADVPQEMSAGVQPNPSSGRAVIGYALPEQTHVRVQIFDVMGRRVALLVDEEQAAGRHEAVFEGAGLSSGTYFYRITTPAKTVSGSLLLVR